MVYGEEGEEEPEAGDGRGARLDALQDRVHAAAALLEADKQETERQAEYAMESEMEPRPEREHQAEAYDFKMEA
jgi:hypothetical protein